MAELPLMYVALTLMIALICGLIPILSKIKEDANKLKILTGIAAGIILASAALVESSVKTRSKADLSPVKSKSGPPKENNTVSRPQKRETIISEMPVRPIAVSPQRASGVDEFTQRLNKDKSLRDKVRDEAQKLSKQGKTAKEIKKIINEKFSR